MSVPFGRYPRLLVGVGVALALAGLAATYLSVDALRVDPEE